jgi:hypothetical protein
MLPPVRRDLEVTDEALGASQITRIVSPLEYAINLSLY